MGRLMHGLGACRRAPRSAAMESTTTAIDSPIALIRSAPALGSAILERAPWRSATTESTTTATACRIASMMIATIHSAAPSRRCVAIAKTMTSTVSSTAVIPIVRLMHPAVPATLRKSATTATTRIAIASSIVRTRTAATFPSASPAVLSPKTAKTRSTTTAMVLPTAMTATARNSRCAIHRRIATTVETTISTAVPIVLIPIVQWTRIASRRLRFAPSSAITVLMTTETGRSIAMIPLAAASFCVVPIRHHCGRPAATTALITTATV